MKIAHCQVSKSGRLSLPAFFRKAMGLEQGGRVVVELDDAGLRVLTQRQAIERAQAITKRLLGDKPGTSVDDFIAERRREAAREEAEYESWKAKGE
jgi:bifunctional DNA-binding transcriptional regulator/antitoxin component of YhaV-PrlF toxin-antitoxin module